MAWDDFLIALNVTPTQKIGAINFYNQIKNNENVSISANISITGHSLGGALAQLVGAETGVETVTFNAPGMKNQISEGSYNNITNYVNLNDWIGCYGQHAGTTCFYLPEGTTDEGSFSPHSKYINENSYYTEFMTDISDEAWKVEYAASLWGYDINNERVGVQQIITSTKASPENLKKAVDIIQSTIGIEDKLETTFHYLTPTGINYVLGDKEDNEIELERTALGTQEHGIAWGNGGNDRITGLDNDVLIAGETNHNIDRLYEDWTYREVLNINNFVVYENTNTLYGGEGNYNIYGEEGDDNIKGGNGNDTIEGGEGNDEIEGEARRLGLTAFSKIFDFVKMSGFP